MKVEYMNFGEELKDLSCVKTEHTHIINTNCNKNIKEKKNRIPSNKLSLDSTSSDNVLGRK